MTTPTADPNSTTDWFQTVWAIAWVLLLAMGGALWRTMASRDYVRERDEITESAIQEYVEKLLTEFGRQDQLNDELRAEGMRGALIEIQHDIRELRRSIDELVRARHA